MIGVYRLVSNAVYLLASPVLRARARRGDPVWRGRLLMDQPDGPVDLWIHAASVGEARMAAILIGHLRRIEPSVRIHVTVMTPAGYGAACEAVSSDATVSYFPIDVNRYVTALFARLRPRALVIAETEIWPNLITSAAQRHIPIVLVNGRMSTRAFGRYKIVKRLFSGLLSRYDRFFLKSEDDLQRFAYFGVSPDKAVITGDMKFDAPLLQRSEGRRRELRHRLGVGDDQSLLVAGSTRPGEEALLVRMFDLLRRTHPHIRMLLAPRHLDRLVEAAQTVSAAGMKVRMYGSEEHSDGDEVILLDRMGVLTELYTAADIAFVGGTLVELGGHNLLEPVWAGTPVLYGPSIDNVTEAAAYITRHNFGRQVTDAEELGRVLDQFLAGHLKFARKTESDLEASATVAAVHYIAALVKGAGVHA